MGHGVFHNTYKTLVGAFLVPTCCQFLAPGAPGTDMILYINTFIGLNDMPEFNKKNLWAQLFSELWLAFNAHKAAMD